MSGLFTFFLLGVVSAQGLGEILSYNAVRFSECQAFVRTCPPITASCANYLCQQCDGLGDATFKSCCAQPTPNFCFQTAFGGDGSVGGIATTADPNLNVCQTALNVLSDCESETSGFTNLDGVTQAHCLCYTSGNAGFSWIPNAFDNAWSSCIAYASTADTTDYPVLLSAAGLCSSAGNVLSAPASVPASITKGAPTSGQTAMAGTGGTPTSATVTATTNASKGSRNEIAFGLSGQYFICVILAAALPYLV